MVKEAELKAFLSGTLERHGGMMEKILECVKMASVV